MNTSNSKILSVAYLLTESFNKKEILKLIVLLISFYYEDDKHRDTKKGDKRSETVAE